MSYTWGYIKDVALSKLDLSSKDANSQRLIGKFPFYANEVITQVCSTIKPKLSYATFDITKDDLFKLKTMPEDFIAFADDINTLEYIDLNNENCIVEATDDYFVYKGYNQLQFFTEGKYTISYKARWFTFTKDLTDDTILNIPTDILECIPSYIAHQCYKTDDEVKSSIFRNEFEVFFSRIDDSHFEQSKSIHIRGDW